MMSPELPDSESGNPEYQSAGSDEDEDEVPVPDHQEDLVVDHVEAQHTQGVLLLLTATWAVPDAGFYVERMNYKFSIFFSQKF